MARKTTPKWKVRQTGQRARKGKKLAGVIGTTFKAPGSLWLISTYEGLSTEGRRALNQKASEIAASEKRAAAKRRKLH